MELFYSEDFTGGGCRLADDEAAHCVKVLRHRAGDEICVIDGVGTLYRCRILNATPKAVEAEVISSEENWGAHPYRLTMAVCPTKNSDRYEWFAEKATEIGVDCIVPVIGEHSERRKVNGERLRKVVLSASKQSLKAAVPLVAGEVSVRDFVTECSAGLKLIAYCFEDEEHPRRSIREALSEWLQKEGYAHRKVSAYAEDVPGSVREDAGNEVSSNGVSTAPDIAVLIGPEGDFSKAEAELALSSGFIPVHLGPSRLRTETAALLATEAVYNLLSL